METHCEACVQWAKPLRFQRVCPLLVETPDGVRCSADTADVRPFWNLTGRYYGGTLAAIYAAVVLTVFIVLRTVGYPISIVHLAWPGLWYRVPQARGWFFSERAGRAFAAGKIGEGLLYLVNAYEFDPKNYNVGLALAKHYQLGQPQFSDQFFERLMRDHPEHRDATAQDWYRALVARGDFGKAAELAYGECIADTEHANFWVRGLLFSTRQRGDDTPLRALLADKSPAARPWRQVVETELSLRAGRTTEVRAVLTRPWPTKPPAFAIYYRASVLAALGDTFGSLDLLGSNYDVLGDNTRYSLQLDVLAGPGGSRKVLMGDVDRLLGQPLRGTDMLPTFTLLCAHLIRFPDPEIFAKLNARVEREHLAFDTESSGIWFSLLCTAGAVGDLSRVHAMVVQLKTASHSSFRALDSVETFFNNDSGARRATSFLPSLPLPLEVTYALIERYPGPPPAANKP